MIKVSVIVPIYSVEKYIERCVRSLMEQTMQDGIEFIFVDDCTPDKSMDILQSVVSEYPHRKPYIHILTHEKNKGLPAARNTGFKIASGEYIIHCDSDDWVESDMYEDMYTTAIKENADIVCTDFYHEYVSHTSVQKQPYPKNNIECINDMLSGKLHCGTWNKLVRKEIYTQNHLSFPNGINMWEDVLTTIPLFFYSKVIVYLPKAYYHYVQYNPNAYTKKLSDASLNNFIEAIAYLEDFFKRTSSLAIFQHSFNYLKLSAKFNLLMNSRGEQQKKWNRLYPEANKYIFSYRVRSLLWRIGLFAGKYNCLFLFNLLVFISKHRH